jgi:hypothetical protein
MADVHEGARLMSQEDEVCIQSDAKAVHWISSIAKSGCHAHQIDLCPKQQWQKFRLNSSTQQPLNNVQVEGQECWLVFWDVQIRQ